MSLTHSLARLPSPFVTTSSSGDASTSDTPPQIFHSHRAFFSPLIPPSVRSLFCHYGGRTPSAQDIEAGLAAPTVFLFVSFLDSQERQLAARVEDLGFSVHRYTWVDDSVKAGVALPLSDHLLSNSRQSSPPERIDQRTPVQEKVPIVRVIPATPLSRDEGRDPLQIELVDDGELDEDESDADRVGNEDHRSEVRLPPGRVDGSSLVNEVARHDHDEDEGEEAIGGTVDLLLETHKDGPEGKVPTVAFKAQPPHSRSSSPALPKPKTTSSRIKTHGHDAADFVAQFHMLSKSPTGNGLVTVPDWDALELKSGVDGFVAIKREMKEEDD